MKATETEIASKLIDWLKSKDTANERSIHAEVVIPDGIADVERERILTSAAEPFRGFTVASGPRPPGRPQRGIGMAVKARHGALTKGITMSNLVKSISHLNPCGDAVRWLRSRSSWVEAWSECDRGDWMLWLVGKLSGAPPSDARKKLVLCTCECARLALPIFEKNRPSDDRVRKCIETAERWANSEATIDELRAARSAAYTAAYTATAAATAAADAAAYAAATAAAATTAYATAAAATAAYATAAADAKKETLSKCADIVRKHCPVNPMEAVTT